MSAASNEMFRQIALERLSSPEQLDRLITLTPPTAWAALAALGALLTAIIGWGLFGSVPTRLAGAGILVERGGRVFDAMAPAAGLLSMVAETGTVVHRGDVIARLDDSQAQQDLLHAQNLLADQEQQLSQLKDRFDREIAARQRVDGQQRENLETIVTAAEQRKSFYESALQSQAPAAANGFITQRFMQETRQQVDDADQEVRHAHNDQLALDAAEIDQLGTRDQEVWRQQEAVNAARRAVEELTIGIERTTRVVSPIDGKVTEAKANAGAVVAPGKAIVSIATAGEGLELVLYLPPDQGKKIAPGMEVRIEPATVKKEEFGTLVGEVLEVSQFPASPEGMMAVLQNPELVDRFSAQGAPYAARVALKRDAAAPSGYAWSAGKGPPTLLTSGTTAAAEVTVREQAPITLVLPLLQESTGIGG